MAAAADAQRELAAHEWGGGVEVKVRMGVHTGEPKVGEERYVGIGVHRAARIGAAGHGGQVLLSSTTKELAEEDLPPGVTIRDLGERRLKDIDQPQHLYQLIVEGLQSNFAQLKTLDVDDRWLTIGSANLNEHSFFNDTEMNVVAHDPDLARRTRMRLWSEHLELAENEIPGDPVRAIDELWKPISEEQLERREAGRPLTHRVARLPHVSKRSARLLGPVNGMLVDG